MSTELAVANIPPAVLEKHLRATFARFGLVDTAEISGDSGTGVSRGFVTVATARHEDAATAIQSLNFSRHAGRTIGVSRSQ